MSASSPSHVMNAQIKLQGAEILHQPALSVLNPTAPQTQKLIKTLIDTALSSNGVGIAAPQIGQPDRIFVITSRPNCRYPSAPNMEPTAIINPCIVATGEQIIQDWEGCLSVPDTRALVPRFREIEVEYLDKLGCTHRRVFVDFIARIFQHELDHLDGILFPERVADGSKLYSEVEYLQHVAAHNLPLKN